MANEVKSEVKFVCAYDARLLTDLAASLITSLDCIHTAYRSDDDNEPPLTAQILEQTVVTASLLERRIDALMINEAEDAENTPVKCMVMDFAELHLLRCLRDRARVDENKIGKHSA